jgi:hypothetical protein
MAAMLASGTGMEDAGAGLGTTGGLGALENVMLPGAAGARLVGIDV